MEEQATLVSSPHKYFMGCYIDPNKGYYDASHEFYELRKELKSKGVSLSKADTLKAFEIFLRGMLGYKYNQSDIYDNDMLGVIQSITPLFVIAAVDDDENIDPSIDVTDSLIEGYRQYYRNIHLHIDKITEKTKEVYERNLISCIKRSSYTSLEDAAFVLSVHTCSRISKLNDVLDNLNIILPEFYRFNNEIIEELISMYNTYEGKFRYITIEKSIQFSENEYADTGKKVVVIQSNAISPNTNNSTIDLIDTSDLKYEVHSYDPIMGTKQK